MFVSISFHSVNVIQADEHKRSTWLFSSNTANIPFYNHFGFQVKGQYVLGDDNPTYEGPPVVVVLVRDRNSFVRAAELLPQMVREYEGDKSCGGSKELASNEQHEEQPNLLS